MDVDIKEVSEQLGLPISPGNAIPFVKKYRDLTGCGLREAKKWWDRSNGLPPEIPLVQSRIDIGSLDKAQVLVALYNASKQRGLGFLDARGRDPLTVGEARRLLEETEYFDYLQGRVMKVDLSGKYLDTWGYDRDNGPGAAERALRGISGTK